MSSETRDHEQPSTGQRSTRGKTFDVRARPGQEPGTDPADGTGAPESTQLSRSRPRRERRPGTSDLGTRARESLCHVHSRARVSARAPILMCALRPIAPQAVGCRRPLRPLRSSWLLRCERPFCCSPDGVVHRALGCLGSRGLSCFSPSHSTFVPSALRQQVRWRIGCDDDVAPTTQVGRCQRPHQMLHAMTTAGPPFTRGRWLSHLHVLVLSSTPRTLTAPAQRPAWSLAYSCHPFGERQPQRRPVRQSSQSHPLACSQTNLRASRRVQM